MEAKQFADHLQKFDQLKPLDRLVTDTCRVLAELRISDLNKKNNLLELRLFFTIHNPHKLMELMNQANFGMDHDKCPQCPCETCYMSGRGDEDAAEEYQEGDCVFMPWFQELCETCGLKTVDVDTVG
jgi:hypothetical protein